jgi:hypothetical protein
VLETLGLWLLLMHNGFSLWKPVLNGTQQQCHSIFVRSHICFAGSNLRSNYLFGSSLSYSDVLS